MYNQGEGPILESRHHEGLQLKRKNPIVVIFIVFGIIMFAGVFFFIGAKEEHPEEGITEKLTYEEELLDEYGLKQDSEIIEEEVVVEKEGQTVDFFYERALQRDSQKKYDGAVEDYTKAIEMAKKYSDKMWESLNNRGVIQAEQFGNYPGALKDFNKIIDIELNRTDGEVDAVKLESAYSNRAYVKMAQNNNIGACDDLYEALSYADENSMAFLEKKIAKICE